MNFVNPRPRTARKRNSAAESDPDSFIESRKPPGPTRKRDGLIEDMLTALVLALAHDLALESRRRGIDRTDYIADAVALIRHSRPQVLGLLRP